MQEIHENSSAAVTRNELVLFLLDGSGSMRAPADTSNDTSPSKSSVLDEIVREFFIESMNLNR
ncbi:MAG: hypothetical protein IPN14_08265 [Bacteroidetes bacterium]|nr:hypothetical protein [Bacteroidota bacterium]